MSQNTDAGGCTFISMSPLFLVDDLTRAAKFYVDVLNFDHKWSWGEPVVRVGVGPKQFAGPEPLEIHLITDPKIGPSATSFVYVLMTNIDAFYARCVEQQAEIYLELGDRPWGVKDFRVADPFGNRLGFGEVTA